MNKYCASLCPRLLWLVAMFVMSAASSPVLAAEVRVAVASNFHNPLKLIAKKFEAQTGHRVLTIAGSTGKLYAQILQGAPFDILLAADSRRPRLLEENGQAVSGSRFTFALGKLALWSAGPDTFLKVGKTSLERMEFKRLAMANPKTAPYGLAARQTLERLSLWSKVRSRIVRGENIGQTFQFVLSGNAELGFVALSQIMDPKNKIQGNYWEVPSEFYDPLRQDAVLLLRGKSNPAAKVFLDFLKSDEARNVILSYGYELP